MGDRSENGRRQKRDRGRGDKDRRRGPKNGRGSTEEESDLDLETAKEVVQREIEKRKRAGDIQKVDAPEAQTTKQEQENEMVGRSKNFKAILESMINGLEKVYVRLPNEVAVKLRKKVEPRLKNMGIVVRLLLNLNPEIPDDRRKAENMCAHFEEEREEIFSLARVALVDIPTQEVGDKPEGLNVVVSKEPEPTMSNDPRRARGEPFGSKIRPRKDWDISDSEKESGVEAIVGGVEVKITPQEALEAAQRDRKERIHNLLDDEKGLEDLNEEELREKLLKMICVGLPNPQTAEEAAGFNYRAKADLIRGKITDDGTRDVGKTQDVALLLVNKYGMNSNNQERVRVEQWLIDELLKKGEVMAAYYVQKELSRGKKAPLEFKRSLLLEAQDILESRGLKANILKTGVNTDCGLLEVLLKDTSPDSGTVVFEENGGGGPRLPSDFRPDEPTDGIVDFRQGSQPEPQPKSEPQHEPQQPRPIHVRGETQVETASKKRTLMTRVDSARRRLELSKRNLKDNSNWFAGLTGARKKAEQEAASAIQEYTDCS